MQKSKSITRDHYAELNQTLQKYAPAMALHSKLCKFHELSEIGASEYPALKLDWLE